ncbi:stress response protein NST1-like isoform X4 [Silurus meridionalis]|uniref:stress response protein NST1-like isoform X4 n=1 Tax=Silurus meridionalis TaxID=175797 RepID=UPI001EEC8AEC|nr:stress response protein NST1-like isoform X4 [Silurus meridionalis]
MMKLRRSSTNEEEGNQSGKRSERDQRRGGELCNGGRLLPVPAEVTHRSEEERETEPGRERERERERVTAEASQSLEQQPDGRLSIWRRAREAQTGHLNPEGFHFLQPKSPKKSSRSLQLKRMRKKREEKKIDIKKHKKACGADQPRTSAHQPQHESTVSRGEVSNNAAVPAGPPTARPISGHCLVQ